MLSNATTFGVSTDDGTVEWAGESLRHLLCKPSSIFDLGIWRMAFDIARFNACGIRVLFEDGDPTIEVYVKREGYSAQFMDMFLVVCTRTHPRLCGLFGSVTNCYTIVIAHDGSVMEPPPRCGRSRLPNQDPSWLPAQPQSLATHRESLMAHLQGWQVRNLSRTALVLIFCRLL